MFCDHSSPKSTKPGDHFYADPAATSGTCSTAPPSPPRGSAPDDDSRSSTRPRPPRRGRPLLTTPAAWDVDALVAKVERWQPEWLAFTAKGTAQGVARTLGVRRPQLGPTDWHIGDSQVFVLPGTSGANQRKDYDGRPDRLSWWRTLADLVRVTRDTPLKSTLLVELEAADLRFYPPL